MFLYQTMATNTNENEQNENEQSENEQNETSSCKDSCCTILQTPRFYVIVTLIIVIYSIILIAIEWDSDCYGVSKGFTYSWYLICTIIICIIYKIYLILLSGRYCKILLIKPKIGLIFTIFLGNSILLIFWIIIKSIL